MTEETIEVVRSFRIQVLYFNDRALVSVDVDETYESVVASVSTILNTNCNSFMTAQIAEYFEINEELAERVSLEKREAPGTYT